MHWSDVAGKAIDLIKTIRGASLAAIILILAFAAYALPIIVLTVLNIQGTDRIVTAIEELKSTINEHRLANRN